MNKIVFSHFFLLIANLIYALNYTLAKDVMPNYINPSAFILLRVSGALLLFSLTFLLFVRQKVNKRDISRFAICGLFGVTINQLLFFEGLNLTTPINASIIMTSNPILVIVMSFLILKEKLTFRKGCGIIFGVLGSSFLILNGGEISNSSDVQIGNLFVFINAISYGMYLVLVKPLMIKYQPITVMIYVFIFGFILVIPFGFSDLLLVSWSNIPRLIYWEILYVVVCTTFIAYLFNSSALKNLSPTTVSIYIYFQPVLATLFAIFRNSDSLDKYKIISSLIIFFGVYLVSVGPRNEIKKKLS